MEHRQPPKQLRNLVWLLLKYLAEYPEAKDTSIGVRRWWLGPNSGEVTSQEVQQTLDWLLAAGWMTKRTTTTREVIFGLNPNRKGDIPDMMRSLED